MANITTLIQNIRKAVFGKDVRESIASAIEQTYEDASTSGNANMEVIQARGTFDTLNQRLNNSDSVKADKTEVSTVKNNLQTQINSLASGSPKGSYSSVSDLVNANPDTGVYVIQADGHVYSWTRDTENVIDLGIYQATEIANNSIDDKYIKEKNVSINKLNYVNSILNLAESILNNKAITGYSPSTHLPTYTETNLTSVAIFNKSDLPDSFYFYLTEYENAKILGYTENVSHQVITLASLKNWPDSYIPEKNIVGFKKATFNDNITKVAITLDNNFIYVNNILTTSDFANRLENKQKINGNNITNFITGDKINLNKVDLLKYGNKTENVGCSGYNTTSFLPILNYSAHTFALDFELNETLINLLKKSFYNIPKKITQPNNTELYPNMIIAYTPNNSAINYIRNNLINSQYYDENSNFISLGNFFNDDIYNYSHILFICDYDKNLQLYTELFDENNPNFNLLNDDIELVINRKFKVLNNHFLNIYPQNITTNVNTNKLNNIKATTPAINTGHLLSFQGTWTRTETISVKKLNKKIHIQSIPINSGNGQTKKCLFIGDSLTDADTYTAKLLELFENDVMSIELLGTLGSGNNKNEGRSGWRAYTYAKCQNGSDDISSLAYTNPFYNSTSEEFDFTYYMNNQNYNSVDYVFLCLGTNDVVRKQHISENEIVSYYNIIINSIKNYNNSIKIGLWLPPARGLKNNYNNLKKRDEALLMNKYLIKHFEEKEEENIFLIPINVAIDPEEDYNTNNINGFEVVGDNVHPKPSGYYKIADVLFSWIKYFATLD